MSTGVTEKSLHSKISDVFLYMYIDLHTNAHKLMVNLCMIFVIRNVW